MPVDHGATGLPLQPSVLERLQLLPNLPAVSTAASSDANDDGPFSEVKRRKPPRTAVTTEKPRRRDFVTGSGGPGFRSLTGVEPNRHLFIYGVSACATEDDLKDWITTHHEADLKHFQKLQPSAKRAPDATSQSFHITVPLKDYDVLCKPESWPDGIKVRLSSCARNRR